MPHPMAFRRTDTPTLHSVDVYSVITLRISTRMMTIHFSISRPVIRLLPLKQSTLEKGEIRRDGA